MGQYSDVVRTINDTISGSQTTIRDAFDLAAPTGDAPHVTHITFFHKFTFGDAANVDISAPISAAINSMKIQIGGKTILDYTSPLTVLLPATAKGDTLEVMLKKVGGQAYLYPYVNDTDTVVYSWFRIPVGIAFPNSQSKRVNLEIVYGGGTAAEGIDANAAAWASNGSSSVSSTELQIICDYGIAREAVTFAPSIQFNHSASSTQVVTVPGDASRGQMLGIVVGNDQQEEGFGSDGLRPNLGGFLNIPSQYIHFLNGDTTIGFVRGNKAGPTTEMVRYPVSPGATWLNTYRITSGVDVDIIVNNGSEQTYRYYFPVYVQPLSAKDAPKPKQNLQTVSSVTGAVVTEAQGSQ